MQPNQVKVGQRGKYLLIPDEYVRLQNGEIAKIGDKFANLLTIKWQDVENDDIGLPSDAFDYLIRPRKNLH